MEKLDKMLFIPFILLVMLGCLMVFSASANVNMSGSFGLFAKHLCWVCFGFVFLFFALIIPVESYQKYIYYLLLLAVILLAVVLIPGLGKSVKGAKRWYNLFGFSFQPSFLAKWILLVYIASSLSKKMPEKLKTFKKGILPYLVVLGVLGVLFLKEPDFGGFVVITIMSVAMLILAGTRIKYWIIMSILASPFIYWLSQSEGYRVKRLLAFREMWKYSQSYSYQIVQSIYSFAAGGIIGAGLGQGQQKLSFLPEAHTDFIFAVVGEELGFLGAIIVVLCFVFIAVRGFYISYKLVDNHYLCYLAFGMTLFISFEAFFNIAVSISMAPPKGLPLPFLSYGGTATVVYMYTMGVLLNLSRRAN